MNLDTTKVKQLGWEPKNDLINMYIDMIDYMKKHMPHHLILLHIRQLAIVIKSLKKMSTHMWFCLSCRCGMPVCAGGSGAAAGTCGSGI